jgi:Uma2 family endonuclease
MAATAELEIPELTTPTPAMPRDEASFYELVDGRWVEKPPMSYLAGLVATELVGDLSAHIRQQTPRPGILAVEVLFRIPLTKDSSRKRRPDIAFVSSGRWPIERPRSPDEDAWDVVPDLAVEVVSPTDIAGKLLDKVREYFQAGVRLVWIVYPVQRCIYVYEAWNRIRVLTESDSLDGGDVLPGFHRPLDRLFGPVAEENGEHE